MVTIFCTSLNATEFFVPSFEHYGRRNGLTDLHILCGLQDSYGFMWFGTRNSLQRYDGVSFRTYKHDPLDSNSIEEGGVTCIFEDHAGILWLGMGKGGISRFNRETETFVNYPSAPENPNRPSGETVFSMCEDSRHNLWITFGSEEARTGINRFDNKTGRFIRYKFEAGKPYSPLRNRTNSVVRDSSGAIWMASFHRGINRFDPSINGFRNSMNDSNFAAIRHQDKISRLAVAPGNRLWAFGASLAMSIPLYNGTISARSVRETQYHTFQEQVFSCMTFLSDGDVWSGTEKNGLIVFRKQTHQILHITHDPSNPGSLSGHQIYFVLEDRTGNVWIGTDNGINRISRHGRYFHNYRYSTDTPEGLNHDRIRYLTLDKQNRLWVGTAGGGLNIQLPGTRRFQHEQFDIHSFLDVERHTINVIHQDAAGHFWLGTNSGIRVVTSDLETVRRYNHQAKGTNGLFGVGVWCFAEAPDGAMWIGTLHGGLNRLDMRTGTFRLYQHSPHDRTSIVDNNILSLLIDSRGILWVGTNGGLCRYKPESDSFINFTADAHNPNSLSNNRVWYIHESARGELWLATSGGGVVRFSPEAKVFQRYTETEGLADNMCCAILEDGSGCIWVSSFSGISKIDPVSGHIVNFSAADGINVSEFHFKTGCRNEQNGQMYFGGSGGFVEFHPDSLNNRNSGNRTIITGFRIFDTEHEMDSAVYLKRLVNLANTENSFSIEFSNLDYNDPLGSTYRYTLENYDDTWRVANGGRPVASYTRVPPDTYTFRVQGTAKQNSLLTHSEHVVTIVIHPALHQEGWFRTLLALALLGIVVFIVRSVFVSMRQKEQFNRRLVEYRLTALRAQMNPHFIFNSLNSIVNFVARNDSESAHIYLTKFARLIRAVLESSKSEYITLQEEIEALRYYLELEALRFSKHFAYTITIAEELELESIKTPPLLIQPYVENAIKHGLAHKETRGTLTIDLATHGKDVRCSVIDDGIGRARAGSIQRKRTLLHTSMGMSVTKERIDIIAGVYKKNFRVEVADLYDDKGQASGTRVDIYIPRRETS